MCALRQIAVSLAKDEKQGQESIYAIKNHDCHWTDFAETQDCSTNFCKELPYRTLCVGPSPRHGASSGCEWRNGLRYGGWLRINWISRRGQPTRGGPSAWGVRWGANNSSPWKTKCYEILTGETLPLGKKQSGGKIPPPPASPGGGGSVSRGGITQ